MRKPSTVRRWMDGRMRRPADRGPLRADDRAAVRFVALTASGRLSEAEVHGIVIAGVRAVPYGDPP